MSKKLKNTTGNNIQFVTIGIRIPSLSTVTINTEDMLILASQDSIDEITPWINSGDIIVADDIGDIPTTARMIDYLKYSDNSNSIRFLSGSDRTSGFNTKNVQEAIEESRFNNRTEINDIVVPEDKILQVHSSTFLKELKVDGEVYIL